MAIMRYRGGDYDLLRREMDRVFEGFFPNRSDANEGTDGGSAVWAPRADVAETEDGYLLSMDLPGVKAEDLDVTYEDGVLKISGERSLAREHESGQYHRIERAYGRFFRSFRFGENADPDKIEADFDGGVLTLRVGKAEQSRPRRIEVGSRAGQSETGDANGQQVEVEA